MFARFYRFLCGYVRFIAYDGFTERFLNLCSRSGIFLWDLKRSENGITASVSIKHYRKIRQAAVRSGMVTKIRMKKGVPFLIAKYKKRIGLLYGTAVAAIFLSIMSTMIWSIDISGNNTVTDHQILTALAQSGVKHGTFRKDINAAAVRFDVMGKIPELSYLTVNVLGSRLEVKVAEQTEEAFVADKSVPCDVVSTADGQIAALEVYHGTALHKQGKAIRAGETLAAGFVELSDGSVRLCHAEAYALIRTDIQIDCRTPRTVETLKSEKEKTYITLHIMGLDIPLYRKADSKPELVRTRTLTLNGVPMPFSLTTQISRTYTAQTIERSQKQLELSAAEEYLLKKTSLLSQAAVCSEKITSEPSQNAIETSGTYSAQISAGKAGNILTD